MRPRQRPLRARRGTAMLLVVMLLVAGSILIAAAAVGGAREEHLTVERLATLRAFYAAEAGMNLAMREVMLNLDEDGDGGVGSISDNDDDADNPTLGSASLVVERLDDAGTISLTSRGSSARAERLISVGVTAGSAGPGLFARYFDLDFHPSRLSQIDWEGDATDDGSVANINYPRAPDNGNPLWEGGPDTDYGAEFTGSISIDTSGSWTFYTNSDDGSMLWIDDDLIVDNDGLHGMRERSGTVSLDAGTHTFMVRFFERGGNHGLIVSWQGPGVSKAVIPAEAFTH